MLISRRNAQKLVKYLKEIVDREIVVISGEAKVIASSHEAFINCSNEITRKVIDAGKEVCFEEHAGNFKEFNGVYFPLINGGDLLFVIGVLGEKKDVRKHSQVIQVICNTLLLDAIQEKEQIDIRYQRLRILEELISQKNMDEKAVMLKSKRAVNYGMNLQRLKYIAIGRCRYKDRDSHINNLEQTDNILDDIMKYIESRLDGIALVYGMNIVCLIYDYEDIWKVMNIFKETVKYALEVFHTDLFFGIGEKVDDLHELKKSYQQAKRSLETAININDINRIRIYDALEVEQFILEIDSENRKKYIKKLFENKDEKYISNVLNLLKKYYQCNGSINQTANELFIHKNTLQYRLNAIKNQLGYDPRKFNDAFLFQLAINFLDMEGNYL